jgi:large subunit ribosomal protein L9
MKVLLCDDIKKLGLLGDVVEVQDGYARNYLIPQGLAKAATDANLRAIAKEKAARADQRLKERNRLEEAARAVDKAEVVLVAKANEQGVLFGSISEHDIAMNLQAQGFELTDEIVQLPEHIKHIGGHTVTLKYADDVTATVNVVIVAEQTQAEPQEPQQEQEQEQQ